MEKQPIGKVAHYYTNIGVIVIELSAPLKVGDKISIEGATSNFTQVVESMEIEHQNIQEAKAGDSIGMKTKERAREGDVVYKVTGE